jgi:hypothetical protein
MPRTRVGHVSQEVPQATVGRGYSHATPTRTAFAVVSSAVLMRRPPHRPALDPSLYAGRKTPASQNEGRASHQTVTLQGRLSEHAAPAGQGSAIMEQLEGVWSMPEAQQL